MGPAGGRTEPGSDRVGHREVVAVHDLGVGAAAQDGGNLVAVQADDLAQVITAVIRQSPTPLTSRPVAQGDDVAFLELAFDGDDADGQQAACHLDDGLTGTVIDGQDARGRAEKPIQRCRGVKLFP